MVCLNIISVEECSRMNNKSCGDCESFHLPSWQPVSINQDYTSFVGNVDIVDNVGNVENVDNDDNVDSLNNICNVDNVDNGILIV